LRTMSSSETPSGPGRRRWRNVSYRASYRSGSSCAFRANKGTRVLDRTSVPWAIRAITSLAKTTFAYDATRPIHDPHGSVAAVRPLSTATGCNASASSTAPGSARRSHPAGAPTYQSTVIRTRSSTQSQRCDRSATCSNSRTRESERLEARCSRGAPTKLTARQHSLRSGWRICRRG
jgi:hypothetical protein